MYRTDLITDPEAMATVDAHLAAKVRHWPSMTRAQLGAAVDRVVATTDRDALRRTRQQQADREVSFHDSGNGLSEIFGRLQSPNTHLVDARLTALAQSVCPADPRTLAQRRADAMAALATDADRLLCRCGQPTCPAATTTAPSPVLIHVVATQSTLDGSAPAPGALIGTDVLIPAELIAQLAAQATLRPLVHPGNAPAEPHYTPTPALADFVRCRDLTCRFPGCDRPAIDTDLDHTIPYAHGGPTCAANIKCLCRLHHLIKTFWGWHDRQLPDGTIIWTSPAGRTHITAPGAALLFPALCAPTGEITTPDPPHPCTDRTAMMPRRRRTRTRRRYDYIGLHRRRTTPKPRNTPSTPTTPTSPPPTQLTTPSHPPDDEPPPF